MRDPSSPGTTALLAAALLLSAALAGCAQSDPPDDPSQLDYIYRSDHPDKAPHPVSFDGGYQRLRTRGLNVSVPVDGSARVPVRDVHPEVPAGPSGDPSTALLAVHKAEGTFAVDGGENRSVDNETFWVRSDAAFTVDGLTEVQAIDLTFSDGEVRARGVTLQTEPRPNPRALLRVGPGGATVEDVRGAFVREADGDPGTLHLEPGNYSFGAGPVAVPDPGALDLPTSDATVTITPADAPVVLRGEDRTPSEVRLDARQASGSVDVGADSATLQVQADQWFEEDRPWFEAAFETTFEDGAREKSVTLEQGENETYWVQGSETGEVGTAVKMRPKVDEGDVRANFGVSWYEDTDPHALRRMAEAFGAAIEGFFQDPATRTFEPGESLYIPFVVGAHNDTAPGTYTVEGWVHGENAKSNRISVEVTVVEG